MVFKREGLYEKGNIYIGLAQLLNGVMITSATVKLIQKTKDGQVMLLDIWRAKVVQSACGERFSREV